MSAFHDEHVPRPALVAAGIIAAIAIAGAGWSAHTGAITATPTAEGAASMMRDLSFITDPDGSLVVTEDASGDIVVEIGPTEHGFIRGVMNSLAFERRTHGVGAEPPYRLTLWENGAMWLEDPSTGARIDLAAYGSGNADAFAFLLDAERESPS